MKITDALTRVDYDNHVLHPNGQATMNYNALVNPGNRKQTTIAVESLNGYPTRLSFNSDCLMTWTAAGALLLMRVCLNLVLLLICRCKAQIITTMSIPRRIRRYTVLGGSGLHLCLSICAFFLINKQTLDLPRDILYYSSFAKRLTSVSPSNN